MMETLFIFAQSLPAPETITSVNGVLWYLAWRKADELGKRLTVLETQLETLLNHEKKPKP